MDPIFLLERRSKALINDAKHHIHLCAAGCLQQASWMHCLDWGFLSPGSMPCTYFYKIIFQNQTQSCSKSTSVTLPLCRGPGNEGQLLDSCLLGSWFITDSFSKVVPVMLRDLGLSLLIFLSHIKIFIYYCDSKEWPQMFGFSFLMAESNKVRYASCCNCHFGKGKVHLC